MHFLRSTAILLIAISFFYACSSDSEDPAPIPVPDTIAPEVDFSIPGNSSLTDSETPVLSNQFVVEVDAQDTGGVAMVEAFINNEKVGEDSTAPYQITIDISGYTSKNNLTGKFTDYMLKVTVTDTSGNETSKEQIIHIDNELPTISAVSLGDGQVIGGDTNLVTFDVDDNEGLSSVKSYLNGTLLQEHTDGTYEINLNTSELTDGENSFKIEAVDLADNVTTYDVVFISDNTGPEITLESFVAGQIVDEPIQLNPDVSDANSTIASVEFLIGDASQVVLEGDVSYSWDLDPGAFNPGPISIFIKATDELGNESSAEFPIEILRRLITINVPVGFFNPNSARLFVFASGMDGTLLDVERIYSDTEMVRLHTDNETGGDFEYMLTFGEYITGSIGNASEFTTVQNINPTNLPQINLNTYYKFEPSFQSNQYPTADFDPDDIQNLTADGRDYAGGFSADTNGNTTVYIEQRRNANSDLWSDSIYLQLFNYTLNEYSYAVLDWTIDPELVVTPSLFTTQGVERKIYQPIMNGQSFESTTMQLFGYFDQDDFNNNNHNNIWSHGYTYLPIEGIPYYISNVFSDYRYNIRINDYFTERTGQPEASFTPVDWTIDYTFLDNQINITNSGIGHTVGKIFIDSDTPEVINGLNISYRWNLVYDSQKQNQVILPEIPEEIQSWGFYTIYENGGFKVRQVEIKGYQGIPDYNGYLDGVIKNNTYPYTVSPKMESKFKSIVPGYYHRAPNFLLD
ncbi:Ig-like domain-containing protein [Allomuricauda sp.]|uniref:Ig-like domain-containing protein n=1 Tax=Flagellimonas sp. TaxID=2058762 RepID=UPI001B2E7DB7|nr:Ig-like domain-containing protein [Allomuricauda sp.]MBO6830904.1 hypothetical protein [Allomuricauda sp.]